MTTLDQPYAVTRCLKAAEDLCARHGDRLTPLRSAILEIVLRRGGPVKAYDIIDGLRDVGKRITPASVYRTLDFLVRYGLVHRVNALNAYVGCSGDHNDHALLMVVCPDCEKTEEIRDDVLQTTLEQRLNELGVPLQDGSVEIRSACHDCRTRAKTES